jgi:hypothetical protein
MAGLGEIAAPPKFLCCAREQMLREHSLHGQKAAKSAKQTSEQIAANVCIPPFL